MDEFELIRKYWMPLGREGAPGIQAGIGDDCAVLRVPPGEELVQSIDTLVEGVHFLPSIAPADLGWRALAVNLSDLAAAGARPLCFSLAISLPNTNAKWLDGFVRGMAELAQRFDLPLVGGDTTRGPLSITIMVQGLVPAGTAMTRGRARAGDGIYVSGTLGDAGAALDWLEAPQDHPDIRFLLERYHRPEPRVALGQLLRGGATACIDISDGLVADLGHILAASGAGADLIHSALPLSDALKQQAGDESATLALSAGDDYELCFTWPDGEPLPETLEARAGCTVTRIGTIRHEKGLRVDGRLWASGGYDHFRESS